MSDFLTRRHGTWHFVRRVPSEFADFDNRVIIRHSTRVRIAEDRTGRRAFRVAQKFNEQLEAFWRAAAQERSGAMFTRYDEVRHCARSLGFDYIESNLLMASGAAKCLDRIEALLAKSLGNAPDPAACAALLGMEKRPACFRGCLKSINPSSVTR
jgi:hypothetical protein